jgi:hypothetical protein
MSASEGQQGIDRRADDPASVGWGPAIVRAAIVSIASVIGFVYIPNLLVTKVFEQAVPRTRDGLVLLWVVAFFVFDCWLFVRLQRGRRRAVRG